MIIKERVKNVEVKEEIFITKDSKEFTDRSLAYHHECILEGTRKVCDKCNGKKTTGGGIKATREVYYPYTDSRYEYFPTETCSKCNGKGYLEIKWC